jgi:hypothetical protein
MNKFFWIFAIFLLFSCQKNEKKKVTISKSIDYSNLNSFVQDSLPIFDVLDLKYSKVYLLWKDIEIIKKTLEITKSDPRTLTFFLETLQSDIEKINEDQIPNELNIPQVIGRFRVFKTHVLKINAEKINFENFNLFKSDLKKIVISYNSLLKMINKISKESLDK